MGHSPPRFLSPIVVRADAAPYSGTVSTELLGTTPPPADDDFPDRLRRELAQRCARNPRYSLRAFARYLEIDHATLSQILRRRRSVSARMIRRLGGRLSFREEEIVRYVAAPAEVAPDDAARAGRARQILEWTQDTATLVSEWQHFALLELVRVEGFRPDARWIGRVLGITVDQVNVTLQRLLRLGLLVMTSRTRWEDRSGAARLTMADFTELAVRRLFEQTHRLALEALPAAPPGMADFSSTTLAVDRSRIPAAVERIARFREELIEYLAGGASTDDVYRLELTLFPVTHLHRKEPHHGPSGHPLADHHEESR